MLCWIDIDSGTYGVGENNIVFVEMTVEEEEVFAELSDSHRIAIARVMRENADDPSFDMTSAFAALDL